MDTVMFPTFCLLLLFVSGARRTSCVCLFNLCRAEMLANFKTDPETNVILLSQRTGSVGINLTEANHVFLMDPAMNPAVEVQAIGRCYRMTQTKTVFVHSMVTRSGVHLHTPPPLLR